MAAVRTIEINREGDPVYENGRFVYLEGIEAVRQILENGIMLRLGEWFLEPLEGINWLKIFSEKPARVSTARNLISKFLNASDFVLRVIKLEVDIGRTTRILSVTFEAQTIAGLVNGEVSA